MKLTEKELNEFPIGTKIYSDDIVYLKIDINNFDYDVWKYTNEEMMRKDVYKIEIPTYTKYIPPKPILDDKEKEYLSAVIRPWRKNCKGLIKHIAGSGEREYIRITKNDKNSYFMAFPCFKAGTMYKGMEQDREYSLEELGI